MCIAVATLKSRTQEFYGREDRMVIPSSLISLVAYKEIYWIWCLSGGGQFFVEHNAARTSRGRHGLCLQPIALSCIFPMDVLRVQCDVASIETMVEV